MIDNGCPVYKTGSPVPWVVIRQFSWHAYDPGVLSMNSCFKRVNLHNNMADLFWKASRNHFCPFFNSQRTAVSGIIFILLNRIELFTGHKRYLNWITSWIMLWHFQDWNIFTRNSIWLGKSNGKQFCCSCWTLIDEPLVVPIMDTTHLMWHNKCNCIKLVGPKTFYCVTLRN